MEDHQGKENSKSGLVPFGLGSSSGPRKDCRETTLRRLQVQRSEYFRSYRGSAHKEKQNRLIEYSAKKKQAENRAIQKQERANPFVSKQESGV